MHRTIGAFLQGMLDKGGGSIVNVSSGASSVRGIPNRYVYGASKAAVIGLTKSVAADFIRRGIRCNAICPGTIQSPSLDDRIATQAKAQNKTIDEIRQQFIDRQPMGRLGTAEEIAAIAVYLASDEFELHDGADRSGRRRVCAVADGRSGRMFCPRSNLDDDPESENRATGRGHLHAGHHGQHALRCWHSRARDDNRRRNAQRLDPRGNSPSLSSAAAR